MRCVRRNVTARGPAVAPGCRPAMATIISICSAARRLDHAIRYSVVPANAAFLLTDRDLQLVGRLGGPTKNASRAVVERTSTQRCSACDVFGSLVRSRTERVLDFGTCGFRGILPRRPTRLCPINRSTMEPARRLRQSALSSCLHSKCVGGVGATSTERRHSRRASDTSLAPLRGLFARPPA